MPKQSHVLPYFVARSCAENPFTRIAPRAITTNQQHARDRMKIAALMIASAATLSGCVAPNPIVSDFNGDSVKIVESAFADPKTVQAAAQKEADRICATRGTKAEYASVRTLPEYKAEYLFLCL
jgi:hypothetical protein